MKLRVQINQAKAFRAGIDATKSWADVEVDPSQLTQETRERIACRLRDNIFVVSLAKDFKIRVIDKLPWPYQRIEYIQLVCIESTLEDLMRVIGEDEVKLKELEESFHAQPNS